MDDSRRKDSSHQHVPAGSKNTQRRGGGGVYTPKQTLNILAEGQTTCLSLLGSLWEYTLYWRWSPLCQQWSSLPARFYINSRRVAPFNCDRFCALCILKYRISALITCLLWSTLRAFLFRRVRETLVNVQNWWIFSTSAGKEKEKKKKKVSYSARQTPFSTHSTSGCTEHLHEHILYRDGVAALCVTCKNEHTGALKCMFGYCFPTCSHMSPCRVTLSLWGNRYFCASGLLSSYSTEARPRY